MVFWCTALFRVLWDCCLTVSCIIFLVRLFSFMQLTLIQWTASMLRMQYDSVSHICWPFWCTTTRHLVAHFIKRFYSCFLHVRILYIYKPWYGCVRHKHFLILETRNRSHPHHTPSYSKYEGISFIFQFVLSIVNMYRSFRSIDSCQTYLCEPFVLYGLAHELLL